MFITKHDFRDLLLYHCYCNKGEFIKQLRTFLCLSFKRGIYMDFYSSLTGPCPTRNAINALTGKWKIPILGKLAVKPMRYNQLARSMEGITNIMLTRSLRELEEVGLISRKVTVGKILNTEYSLTEDGVRLIPALVIIKEWGLQLEGKELPLNEANAQYMALTKDN